MAGTHLPEAVVRSVIWWSSRLAADWQGEIPVKIHDRGVAPDGTPRWSSEFKRYITAKDDNRNPVERLRTTRAFRQLRRKAVREYEVAYRLVALGGGNITEQNLKETAEWLTQRSIRNGHADRYGPNDVLIMLHSGLDKVTKWR